MNKLLPKYLNDFWEIVATWKKILLVLFAIFFIMALLDCYSIHLNNYRLSQKFATWGLCNVMMMSGVIWIYSGLAIKAYYKGSIVSSF